MNFGKLWLIIQREYITRVRTRAFLLGTLLTPLAFGAFFMIQALMINYRGDEKKSIAILDTAGLIKTGMPDEGGVRFTMAPKDATLDQLKNDVRSKKYDGVLELPPLTSFFTKKQTVYFHTDDQLSPEVESTIRKRIEGKIRDYKIGMTSYNRDTINSLSTTDVEIDPTPIDKKEDSANSMTSKVAMGISFFIGIAMYMLVLIWGSIVMRSVMEEKMNRIVEVIMSSVKPFELMMGKIIGSAGVGLTQLILWAILNSIIFMLVQSFIGIDPAAAQASMPTGAAQAQAMAEAQDTLPMLIHEISKQNWWYILTVTFLFFVGGYFMYASMFAAVGSAVGDDMGEAQSLTFPIMIPIILSFLIMSIVVIRAPHSPLAVFASIFPLFSPIVMPGRLAFDPPMWQVILSIVVLIGSSMGFVWLSGRIYRVGILLYGKKVTMKELGKWMFYKG